MVLPNWQFCWRPSARSHLAGEAFVSSHAAICRQRLSRLIFMGACLPAKKAAARMTSHHKASARQPGGVHTGAAYSAVQKGGFVSNFAIWRASLSAPIQHL